MKLMLCMASQSIAIIININMFCKHYCYSLVWLYLEAVTAVIILA